MILAGGGWEVPGAPGGHLLIDLPALSDRLLRGVLAGAQLQPKTQNV